MARNRCKSYCAGWLQKAKSKRHAAPASSPGAAAQPGAQGDAGLCFGLFPPSSARPRPLARALGTLKKEQERVERAGSLETLGHGCSVLFGTVAVWPFAKSGRVAGSGFLVRRRAWLGCSIRRPIRLRHAVFPAPAWPVVRRFVQARRGSDLAWRKPG